MGGYIFLVDPNKNGSDFATLFVNYSVCQISDADEYGRMYRRDALLSDSQVQ